MFHQLRDGVNQALDALPRRELAPLPMTFHGGFAPRPGTPVPAVRGAGSLRADGIPRNNRLNACFPDTQGKFAHRQ